MHGGILHNFLLTPPARLDEALSQDIRHQATGNFFKKGVERQGGNNNYRKQGS